MSFSQITSVDLVVNQITTIVTRYTPSSPAGIHALGDIAPTETIVRTSSNVGLNRINTTPIWSNSVQVYNTQYTLGNNIFNYDAVRGVTGNDARSVISGAGSYGTQTFTYNNQNLGGVVATTPVVDRGASLGGQNFPVYDSVPSVNSIDPVLELSTPVSTSPGGSLAFNSAQSLVVTVGASAALTFGTNPFTIECWLFLTGTGGNYTIYDARNAGSAVAVNFYFQGGNILSLMVSTTNVIQGTVAVTAGVWHHVALSKNSGSTRIFLDGIQIGSTYADANNYLSSGPTIGKNSAGGGGANNLAGYIANFRIVKGTGLYTTQFTPSITAANIANTQLLLSVSSSATYLTDSSVNNFSFTNTGVVYSTLVPSVPGTPAYYTTQYFNSGLNIPYGDITANVSAYSAQTYTAPGTYTWTVPAGVYSITLGAVGAGGGGVQKSSGGNGGNGGNVAYYNSYTVTPGDTYTIVVGAGGAPGAVFGITGGSTYMTRSTSNVAILVAGGGAGGSSLYWQTDDVSTQSLDSSGIIARVTAIDPSARTITYNISSGSLPIGAALNTANGAITWTKQNLSSTTEYAPFTVSATVSLPTQVISKQYTIQIVTTSYAVTASTANVVLYGTTMTFYVRTSGVADGTTLYWTNAGTTTADDFTDGINSGPITITGGAVNLVRTLMTFQPVMGSSRNIIIQLRTGSVTGTVVTTGPTIAAAPQTFAISSNVASMNEGTTVQYTVTTANVATGTLVYWNNSGNTSAADFSDTVNSGSVVINSNNAVITRTIINDFTPEGVENILLQLRSVSTSGKLVSSASEVIVNDTSALLYIDLLVVAGGGGGGVDNGGGGGAGGVVYAAAMAMFFNAAYTIQVGAGGVGALASYGGVSGATAGKPGDNGQDSFFSGSGTNVVALGGGGGATGQGNNNGYVGGVSGGSGGGGQGENVPPYNTPGSGLQPASASGGYGNSGGYGGSSASNTNVAGGGGGGAGAVGGNGVSNTGGAGGVGIINPITGSTAGELVSTSYYLAGGGGGGNSNNPNTTARAGGSGGGGDSNNGSGTGGLGLANTGGGGGACGGEGHISGAGGPGGAGGSGVVVIRYPSSYRAPVSVTGTYTSVTTGGYYIYTWTSSGSITF